MGVSADGSELGVVEFEPEGKGEEVSAGGSELGVGSAVGGVGDEVLLGGLKVGQDDDEVGEEVVAGGLKIGHNAFAVGMLTTNMPSSNPVVIDTMRICRLVDSFFVSAFIHLLL